MANQLQKFLLNDLDVRGVMVHADTEWQELLSRRPYAESIAQLLGEATAATLLMSANVKFDGKLMLQLQSDGDLNLLVVQSDNQNQFRALAKYKGLLGGSLSEVTENGVIIIAIEANIGDEPYQGLVNVHADSLAESVETYFNQSEQLQTLLFLRASNQQIAGVLLQVLPEANISDDDWQRLRFVAETLSLEEFQSADTATMIGRIFAEDDKTIYPESGVGFACGCSDERTLVMLSSLGEEELTDIVEANEAVTVNCDFCGKAYHHDAATIAALLANKIHPN